MDPTAPVDGFRNWLAFCLIAAFIAVLPLLVFKTIPGDNKEIIVYMIGQLSGMATTAIGFYFVNKAGQDALDAKRTENTGKMADAVVAAAAAGSGGEPKPDVTLQPGETAQAAPSATDVPVDDRPNG